VTSVVVRILCGFQWKDLILDHFFVLVCSLVFPLDLGEHDFLVPAVT
jgi:hypothetical protein